LSIMSLVLSVALGAGAGTLAAGLVMWLRRRPKPAARLDELSPLTLARAEEFVAAGKIVQAAKVIHDATGWDLRDCKAVIDCLRARRRRPPKDDFPTG
jgi:uncharacterized iron-regulated membrane protein